MSETKTSQLQQVTSFWKTMADDHFARVEAFCAEVGKLEDRGLMEAHAAAGETIKLWSAWLGYGAELSREIRKLSVEASRKGLELFAPRS